MNGTIISRGVVRTALLGLLLSTSAWADVGQSNSKKVEGKLPQDLLGRWEVLEGPQEGAIFEFFADGKMTAKLNVDGQEGIINATVRVENKKLLSTTKNLQTGKEVTRVLLIRTLSAKEFVVEDDKQNTFKMRRLKEPEEKK